MEENNTAFRRSNSRLSMLDKSLERRRVNKEHNSNFRAGYVAVHEEHLHKTGLRGRKRFLAYLLLFLIYLVAIINLVLTVFIMLALRIDQNGSEVVEFLRGGGIQFKTEVKSDLVLVDTGEFGGYRGQDLEVLGDGQPVRLHHMAREGATVDIGAENTTLRAQQGLHLISPATGNTILRMASDGDMPTPTGMKEISARQVITKKVTPSIGDDLEIESDKSVTIQGNEGLSISAKEINIVAPNISLISLSTMTLEAGSLGGIYLNTTVLPKKSTGRLQDFSIGYTLCVCNSTGKVFRVNAPRRVSHPCGRLTVNPC